MPKRSPKKKAVRLQLSRSPWIYFLFLFSGVASLIYQVVWVQDVDPSFWPYHLFRIDCLVSIYGWSWIG